MGGRCRHRRSNSRRRLWALPRLDSVSMPTPHTEPLGVEPDGRPAGVVMRQLSLRSRSAAIAWAVIASASKSTSQGPPIRNVSVRPGPRRPGSRCRRRRPFRRRAHPGRCQARGRPCGRGVWPSALLGHGFREGLDGGHAGFDGIGGGECRETVDAQLGQRLDVFTHHRPVAAQ